MTRDTWEARLWLWVVKVLLIVLQRGHGTVCGCDLCREGYSLIRELGGDWEIRD